MKAKNVPSYGRQFSSFDETQDKIVRLLKSHQPGFISGQQLSGSLKMSRAAVWKNIGHLRSLGYKIESRQRLGYRLVSKTRLLLPWEVSDGLQTETIGRKIYYYDTVSSTQDLALKLAEKPYENGSIVIAGRQTQGRGRKERKWISPRGGIWLSVLLKPDFDVTITSLLPMLTSLALSIAIEKTLGLEPKVRWPNDITLNNKKVAGILVDASVESNRIDYIIIGVGINFQVSSSRISRGIKGYNYGVGSLTDKNSQKEPVTLLQSFLTELETIYDRMISNKLDGIKSQWEKRSSTIGRRVKISTSHGIINGKAIGISNDGALLVSTNKKIERVLAGDMYYQS